MATASSDLERSPSNSHGLSILQGPTNPELWETSLGDLVDIQGKKYGSRKALISSWQSYKCTYRQIAYRSKLVAKSVLAAGLKSNDCVGILAGNSYQYLEIFLGCARIGCPVVTLNNTYSVEELKHAVSQSDCKILFIAPNIATRPFVKHIEALISPSSTTDKLQRLVLIADRAPTSQGILTETYKSFLTSRGLQLIEDAVLESVQQKIRPADVLNLQFTSGTTGLPKAAVLTHRNLINNARYVGYSMRLTEQDIVCCPPPLFHCFGLVMGFLASFCHGSTLVFPSDNFDARKTVDAIIQEGATALLGVPTMFIAELEVLEKTNRPINTVRTGLAAGSPVAPALMASLRQKMGVGGMLIAYGMTETSPVTFITSLDDSDERMFNTIGRTLPHTAAKIVDSRGNIVPIGAKGEICTAGFALQKGYWKNEAKTKEVMKYDANGIRWMHSGDEGFLDEQGYGHVTGRIKDIIIRGGENISPVEIEDCLLSHPRIGESCVVGLEDAKYGEVVACFLKKASPDLEDVSDQDVRKWVGKKLGRIKEPKYIFWVEDSAILAKTGSGKYQKHLIRAKGNALVKKLATGRQPKL